MHGLAPANRVLMVGTLRVVSERIDAGGRADSKAALDRAFTRLEGQKRSEETAAAASASSSN